MVFRLSSKSSAKLSLILWPRRDSIGWQTGVHSPLCDYCLGAPGRIPCRLVDFKCEWRARARDALRAPVRGHSVHRHASAVDQHASSAGSQRRHRTPAVTLIAFPDASQKVGETNTHAFVFQLVIAALGTLFGTRVEEHLQRGVRKHHGAHVATVGDQARGAAQRALQVEDGVADRLQRRDPRGAQRSPSVRIVSVRSAPSTIAPARLEDDLEAAPPVAASARASSSGTSRSSAQARRRCGTGRRCRAGASRACAARRARDACPYRTRSVRRWRSPVPTRRARAKREPRRAGNPASSAASSSTVRLAIRPRMRARSPCKPSRAAEPRHGSARRSAPTSRGRTRRCG